MSDFTILAIDDSPDTLEIIERNLSSRGYRVLTANDARSGIEFLDSAAVDLVITDLMMPDVDGLDVTRHIRQNSPDIGVVMVTGYATVSGAVEAMKTGVEEYLAKPFTEVELLAAVDRALARVSSQRDQGNRDSSEPPFQGIVGQSPEMGSVFDSVRQVAPTPASVLITGESGTGKELIARAIHYTSPRAPEPFVTINCGAIPENLLESELFGYIKGAFTGAETSRAGFFQTADKGTIFLDEVNETSQAMQVKLLRVLQEKEITMVGSSRNIPVDVRILSATNHNLEDLVDRGLFRQDLYYRLNVVSIFIPPLRNRGQDIILLARMFLDKYSESLGRHPMSLSDRVEKILLDYSWPGNVRELENLIQRLVIMCRATCIDIPDLPENMRFSISGSGHEPRTLEEVEKKHILAMLQLAGNNKTKAAAILGIDRKTLREKLHKFEAE